MVVTKTMLNKLERAILAESFKDGHGYVFDLGEELVAKRYTTLIRANNEFVMGRYVRGRRGSVPSMKGIVDLFDEKLPYVPETRCFVVMENVQGKTLDKLGNEDFLRAEQLWRREMGKILGMGVFPYAQNFDMCYMGNAIYDRLVDRITLIDLEEWRMATNIDSGEIDYINHCVETGHGLNWWV